MGCGLSKKHSKIDTIGTLQSPGLATKTLVLKVRSPGHINAYSMRTNLKTIFEVRSYQENKFTLASGICN
ncbi:hypothetical protein SteCoe_14156 [Stentor coeruleus]|uniref:Uncharacterized protein n=1 Tax=Stentor coeruleus TaxID=5963 RepID=A0A1R2C6Q6_9CILI|nr:hypothetical protein SteCoe_14156 [Stentor coeruleus]